MPTTTRESRALLSLVLSAGLLVGGLGDLGFSLYSGLQGALGDFFPSGAGFGAGVAVVVLALVVVVHLVARSSTKDGPQDDVWHHAGVAASWVSLLLMVMSVVNLVGAIGSNWPFTSIGIAG